MMTINSAFDAFRETRQNFLRGFRSLRRDDETTGALVLRGVEIAIETNGAVYTLSSETPLLESSDPSRATAWPRWVFRLPNGSSIEQQMVLPRGHNAVAFSWRLLDESVSPVALSVTPVFTAEGLSQESAFEREADSLGGRLTWQPDDRALEIIADTNGANRRAPAPVPSETDVARPGTFAFQLGGRPAVLILSLAHQPHGCSDPIIGGFLAQLADEQCVPSLKSVEHSDAALLAA